MEDADDGFEDDEVFVDEESEDDDDVGRNMIPEVELRNYRTSDKFKWLCRPPLDLDSVKEHGADIMVVEVDHSYDLQGGIRVPCVRIFGVNANTNTFLIKVFGFEAYFYVKCPKGLLTTAQCIERYGRADPGMVVTEQHQLGRLKDLENTLSHLTFAKGNGGKSSSEVCSVQRLAVVKKENLVGYKPENKRQDYYLQIFLSDPRHVNKLRTKMLADLYIGSGTVRYGLEEEVTYESNLNYAMRFMIDKGLVGMGWVHLPVNSFVLMDPTNNPSTCQACLEVYSHEKLVARPAADANWSSIAPLRILSLDIECASPQGFPIPELHPAITIACIGKLHNRRQLDFKQIFQLKQCSPVAGANLDTYDEELDMYRDFEELVQMYDPDIITGYNVVSFDLDYLYRRGTKLGAANKDKPAIVTKWTRIRRENTYMKRSKIKNKGMHRDFVDFQISGRIQIDMLLVMMTEHKLSSYTLNNVSIIFLGEQKEDVHYGLIHELQAKGPDERKRIASYCLKDALLPLNLIEKHKNIYNFVEMARVTGVPVSYLVKRGQQIKVLSQIYRTANAEDIIVPVMNCKKIVGERKIGYQGASVLDPIVGFYKDPIATLDFASLYPSIMIAYNICYTSLMTPEQATQEPPDKYVKTPSGHYFVKAVARKGILPKILENLLTARKKTKERLDELKNLLVKQNSDPDVSEKEKQELENLIGVYNGRQLALKVSANSVYGFTGAQVGALPMVELASSITAFGRDMIIQTRDYVLKTFTRSNGYEVDCTVIYGDTDSVMIHFGIDDRSKCMTYGRQLASKISSQFPNPIRLEFEKVYHPFLLFKKKKYAGLLWTSPEKYDYKDFKGIETVRRDNCLMVRKAMEKVLDILLHECSEDKAKNYVVNLVNDLLNGRVDISELVITKSLTKKLDNQSLDAPNDGRANAETYKAKPPHVMLAEKLSKRNPDNPPGIGDRIPYVILAGIKTSVLRDRTEDPVYAMEKGLPLDMQYYLDNQLKGPITRIFEVIKSVNPSQIFEGSHTNAITQTQAVKSDKGIAMFATCIPKCMACRTNLTKDNKGPVCERCKHRIPEIYAEHMYVKRALQQEFKFLWTECQRCQGSRFEDIICSNNDCPIFYRRKKVYKDLESCHSELDRFYQKGPGLTGMGPASLNLATSDGLL